MSTPEPIIADVVFDADVLARARCLHSGPPPAILRVSIVLLGIGSLVVAFNNWYSTHGPVSLFIVTAFVMCGLGYVSSMMSFREALWKFTSNLGKYREDVHFEFYDDRVCVSTKQEEHSFAWSAMRKFKEGSGLILLYRTNDNFLVVPIDQLTEGTRSSIRSMVADRLSEAQFAAIRSSGSAI